MNKLYGILQIDSSIAKSYQFALLIFAFYNITTVFSSVIMLALSAFFVVTAIIISKLFTKLQLDSLQFPILFVFLGTVTTLCAVLLSGTYTNTTQVCISASLITFFVYGKFSENQNTSIINRFKAAGKYLLHLIPLSLIFSFMSEILYSGKILNGFIKNGISFFDFEHNNRLNKITIVLLFFALITFLSNNISKKTSVFFAKDISLKGSVKFGAIIIVISIVFTLLIISLEKTLQNSILIYSLKYFLPYLLTAIFSFVSSNFVKNLLSYYTISSLIFTITVYLAGSGLNNKTVDILITALALLIIMVFNEFCSRKISYQNYLPIILTYSALISIIVTLLFI